MKTSYLTSPLQTDLQCPALRLTPSSVHDGGAEPLEDLRLGGVSAQETAGGVRPNKERDKWWDCLN